MGNYIAQTDLDVYLSDADLVMLTDDAGAGTIDTTKVAECIVAAESEVDSFLAKRYTVPITTTVPETVKEWAVQLTVVRLHQRKLPIPPDIWEMAAEARRQLGMVNKGDLSLDIGTDAPDEPSDRAAEFTITERKFNRTTMADW